MVERMEGVIPLSSRYLRVFLRYGMREKKLRCYNFTGNTFSGFISQVRASSIAYQPLQPDDQAYLSKKGLEAEEADYANINSLAEQTFTIDKQPFLAEQTLTVDKQLSLVEQPFTIDKQSSLAERTFTIDKQQLMIRHRKMARLPVIFCLCPVAILTLIPMRELANPLFWHDVRMQPGVTLIAMFLFLVPLIITLIPGLIYGRRFRRIKQHTPERITVYPDRFKLDNEGIGMTFSFERVHQIRMTPPDFGAQDTLLKHRVLIVKEEGQSYRFTLSDNRDIALPKRRGKKEPPIAFPEYADLYYMLQEKFVDQPEKFVGDMK